MPIIPLVGRKSPKLLTVIVLLYLVLSVGSITMVYPFAMMLAGSISSFYDYDEYQIVPRYLHDDGALFSKFIFEKADITRLGYEYDTLGYDGDEEGAWIEKSTLAPPEPLASWLQGEPGSPTLEQAGRIRADYNEFRRAIPDIWRYAYFQEQYNRFDTYAMFQSWIRDQYTLDEINREWGLAVDGYDIVYPPGEDPQRHQYWPIDDPLTRAWAEFKRDVMPADYVNVLSLNYVWFYYIQRNTVSPESHTEIKSATAYNQVFGTDYGKISEIICPREAPAFSPYARSLWEVFMRDWIPAALVEVHGPDAAFREYLIDKNQSVEEYNRTHPSTPIASWEDLRLPVEAPEDGRLRSDWQEFMTARRVIGGEADQVVYGDYYCALDAIRPRAPEAAYAGFLVDRYGGLEAVNAAYGWSLERTEDLRFPDAVADLAAFMENRGAIRRHFLVSNYKDVFQFMAINGRALWNTLILVVLIVGCQLTVNPMAAYALSRFRLKYTSQILLFLLATMAFPAEVAMIPSFLMIKEFGLLNTYWAIVLPTVANGFGIFLLKGFFDSLPSELYEAGLIDGASELRMFFNITLPLSKPILAVLALGAFTMAYGEFMFAFLVCQKQEMWTLMVFLYQYQQTASVPLVLTSLVVSSIPTLLVFLFCQNIILRGIVVPSFK